MPADHRPAASADSDINASADPGVSATARHGADSAFALPANRSAKLASALIDADDAHLHAVADSLASQIADLDNRLDAERRNPGRSGTAALERDQEIHRLTARLRTLRRFGLEACLGRFVTDDGAITYVGRLGLSDATGARLLVDWRSPAAEPFFAATHAARMGVVSRRRYRWSRGRISDYWDEVLDPDAVGPATAPDEESALMASLGASRSDRMRDVLVTIAADQDAIVRADSDGALVVDGGPGTGKTVVALHRAAYLLYADPRLDGRRGGVLVVGPTQPYVDYIDDVLPSLGEESVQIATLHGLVPEGSTATPELDAAVASLKASAEMVDAIDAAVRFYEDPPTDVVDVELGGATVRIAAADWARACDAVGGTPHNEAHEPIYTELAEVAAEQLEDEVDPDDLVGALRRDPELSSVLRKAWPVLEATDVVGDLWSVPAYLRRCAPWLEPEQVRALQRTDPAAWTDADLPLLDAARARLGDPDSERRRRQRAATLDRDREAMDRIVSDLIEHDDSDLQIMSMLRGDDLRAALVDPSALPDAPVDRLAGLFAHVIVDEAQELTDAQWRMLLRRCPSQSLTVVGDRAQARHGFTEAWKSRLDRVGLRRVREATLSISYRTPSEVMDVAEVAIRSAIPDANVPTSVRSEPGSVVHADLDDLDELLREWLDEHDGVGAVIGTARRVRGLALPDRVRAFTPELVKGLEFDLVALLGPEAWGGGIEGAVDRYVAMTRATQRLLVLR